MANLYPTGYENEVVTTSDLKSTNGIIGYKAGVAFDFEQGDFTLDGKNQMQDASGVDSWESWCRNCICTQRCVYLAYSSNFGVDYERALQADSHEEAETLLTREITEALLADPYGRTGYIESITYTWQPDALLVDVIVHGVDDVTIDITALLPEKGS